MSSSTNTPESDDNNDNNPNNNSYTSLGMFRSINRSHRCFKEIFLTIPMEIKQDFINLVSKLHGGHVSNYQNYEFNKAIEFHIESWMNTGEKLKTGIFSLSVNTCPKPNIISKLTYLVEIAKIQPPFPKFTMQDLLYISEITFGTKSDLKTRKKFADLLKTFSDVDANDDVGIEREYDLANFSKCLERMRHIKSQKEKDVFWTNHFGYKFNIGKNLFKPEFEKTTKMSTLHMRLDEFRKKQLDAIVIEKYSGVMRYAKSYEYALALSNYI